MSEVQTAVEAAVEQILEGTKERRESVSKAKLVTALKRANGVKTAKEVADELGMTPEAFAGRLTALRNEWRDDPKTSDLPFPFKLVDGRKGGNGGVGGKRAPSLADLLAEMEAAEAE